MSAVWPRPTADAPGIVDDAGPWTRALALLATAWALIAGLFARDLGDMVGIWWDSSTFNHCLLMVPIIAWLVQQRLPVLRRLTPAGWWPGLVLAAGAVTLWLLGELAGVALLRQLGVVSLLIATVPAVLGPRIAAALAFPLGYALLLVPAGEELVPALQTLTASMSMALLAVVGIPAHIDGVFITTPNGYFEVAEACSGVKFLIAMVAYGVLVAHLCFRRWGRRLAFMAFALAVPVVANGLRAFGTIWIADRVDISFAASFDHVFYGWVFFGIVILLVMLAAYPFFDRPADDPPTMPAEHGWMRVGRVPLAGVAAGLALLIAAPPLWAAGAEGRGAAVPSTLTLTPPAGWTIVPDDADWRASFAGADRRSHWRLAPAGAAEGRDRVDVAFIAYARQGEGRELVGFGQGAAGPGGAWEWTETLAPIAGARTERITAKGARHRTAVTILSIDGERSRGGVHGKWLTLRGRLPGRDPAAVAVVLSTPEQGTRDARALLERFIADAGGPDRLVADVLDR